MKSVKEKLFVQIGLLVVLLVGLMILANTLFYEPYYLNKLKGTLAEYYNEINSIGNKNYEDELKEFIKAESLFTVDILIADSNKQIVYTSNSYFIDDKMKVRVNILRSNKNNNFTPLLVNGFNNHDSMKLLDPNRPPIKIIKIDEFNEFASYYLASSDILFSNRLLILSGTLKSGELFELKVPMAAIKKSIHVSNRFMLICGGFIFIIAMLYAYVLSYTFTKPIREMNRVTKEMKELNFNHSCKINSSDELGELALDINELSVSLSRSMEALNEKNSQLEELINNVSHELKTPLALLQGYAEGIQLNIANDKDKTDFYTSVIIDEAKKMNRIVETLLNIRSLESDQRMVFRKSFNIGELIEMVLQKFDPLLKKENIQIAFNIRYKQMVLGDAFDVEQILVNYISNAINYVNEAKDIKITVNRKDTFTRIYVYNSCEIFTDEEIKTLWNKFSKRDIARSRDSGGHGLGLSIVRAIQYSNKLGCGVENHNEGVSFWFDISNE